MKDRPLEIVLNPMHAADLGGTVALDDDDGSGKVPQISIDLQNLLPIPGGSAAKPKADGAFTIEAVAASRYRLIVNGPGVFAKSVWLGNTEITDGILDLTAGSPGPLRIQLSTKTATITGTLPPGTSAIVISQDGSPGSYGVAVDSTGHFHAKGIPPGKYRLCQTIPGVS